ncbi:Rrf2 family transcriptional regulator [Exiguobacterium sp. BMC-KP]|uniref:RrF2 family transcriptional regulator n=1 Tax=Exiguobacterium sp. BMC-KP TaxID=1684312 RepID=UPI0006AA3707|nr:Rrf2 family transcriptional regulator [Exiguobacterium sp. BMC-KP]KOP29038.1 Rrf2 family transcriptional regulator [Exiguobacterium sp. BMC-KP]
MKLSKATNYALHTMLFLAVNQPHEHVGVALLAKQQGVSPTYLSKILTKLVKTGMVISTTGATGGYKLKPSWEEISLLDVIIAIEGVPSMSDACLNNNPNCLIQKSIEAAEHKFLDSLRHTLISDLSTQVNETSSI